MNVNSKIYIAGHQGLVGSAIWKGLQEKGYQNLIGRSFNELDLRSQDGVADFFATEKPEYVFLAAAKVGGIMANNTYRGEFIYDNLMIQNNVIHQSYSAGVKKLLFLGSTCKYPREAPQPMKEDYLLTSALEYTNEPYAIAKIAGIKLCESYNIQFGTDFIPVMPTNIYGPNDNFDLDRSHVLPALLRKIHLGRLLEEGDFDGIREDFKKRQSGGYENLETTEAGLLALLQRYGITRSSGDSVKVEIWGSGKPMREFLWSDELADACIFIMENISFSDLIKGQVEEIRNTHINIGTGKEISISDLAELIKQIVGFRGDFIFNTTKPDGTMRKLTDVNKLHSLGWKHKIDIQEGLERVYRWMDEVV